VSGGWRARAARDEWGAARAAARLGARLRSLAVTGDLGRPANGGGLVGPLPDLEAWLTLGWKPRGRGWGAALSDVLEYIWRVGW